MGNDDAAEPVADYEENRPHQRRHRHQPFMVWTHDHADHMGNDESHEADDSRRVHRKAHDEGAHQQVGLPVHVKVRAHGNGGLIAQEHEVQHPALGPEEEHRQDHDGRNHRQLIPPGTGEAPHEPVCNGLDAVLVVGKVHDEAGKSGAYRGESHACQKQLHRRRPAAEIGNKEHRQRDSHGSDEGGDAHEVRTQKGPYPQKDGSRSTKGSTGRNAQDIGIRQGVLHDGLHHHAAHREPRPHQGRQHQPREAQEPHNIMDRSLPRRLDGSAAFHLLHNGAINLAETQMDRTDGESPEEGGHQNAYKHYKE